MNDPRNEKTYPPYAKPPASSSDTASASVPAPVPAASMNRRQVFSSRMRTTSHGSTRGAFGPLPVDASAHNPQDIYKRQQQALTARNNIDGTDSNQHHLNRRNSTSNKKKAFHSPGQSIGREAGDKLAQIVLDTMRMGGTGDEEMGRSGGHSRDQYNHDQQPYYHHASEQSHPLTSGYPNDYDNVNHYNEFQPPPYGDNRREQLQGTGYDMSRSSLNYSYPSDRHPSDRDINMADAFAVADAKQRSYGGVDHSNNSNRKDENYSNSSPEGNDEEIYGSDDEEEEEEEILTWFQYLVYHKNKPEFTSVQSQTWAIILGVVMGFFTYIWGNAIEFCVDFTWKEIPEYLLEKGIFTDLDGRLPLPYYFIICPAIFGGILSYITAALTTPKVPGQNEWIESLHRVGIMDHTMFLHVIALSTLGMASGLSLGPEMPLVLSAGMIGSVVAVMCKQSVLSARVLNLTAASAAIGGFFGFPMAGALFVLELPHRMGLQYFEALNPSVLASIVSVIVNRKLTGDEVKGMFKYPFLSDTLPNNIFPIVIVYGIVGSIVGVMYAEGLLWLKHWVHDWFHAPHDDHNDHNGTYEYLNGKDNTKLYDKDPDHFPLLKKKDGCCTWMQKGVQRFFGIKHEPTRAAVAGVLAGALVGLNCMLLPHNLFWGEAQLQTMIDRGMTRLPVFGYDDEPTAIMTAYGYCLIDPGDQRAQIQGFSTACAGTIFITKIIIVGLSLGTGICGGHFWAPLFVGCAASHFFTDLMALLSDYIGFGSDLSAYPCLAVLCIMGSTHVVTFRAQMAIILVLTLSIKSFSTAEKLYISNGDYSAIFPLLVIACSIPLFLTRSVTFYAKQVCRGDLIAIPEVLCEPNKAGTTQGFRIDNMDDFTNSSRSYGPSDGDDDLSDDEMSDDISLELNEDDNGNRGSTTPRTVGLSLNSVSPSPNTPGSKGRKIDLLSVSHHSMRSSKIDPLSVSHHSMRSTRSSSSRKSNSVRAVGKIVDSNYQKPLLSQGREGASTLMRKTSRSGTPVNSGPNIPRHRRLRSTTSTSSNYSPK